MRSIAFATAVLVITASAALAQDVSPAPPAQTPPATEQTQAPPEGYSATPAGTPGTGPGAPPAPTNPPMTGPQLSIQTTLGEIVLQLDNVRAPRSVAHILRMARAGHYNGTSIYRVEKNFVIQMGSWLANGEGRGWFPRPVPLEANNGLKNYRYAVALPRGDDPNGAGPDFFINMRDNTGLDQKAGDTANTTGFAVFGHVMEASLPVVQAINEVPVNGGVKPFPAANPATPVIITRISVVGDPPPKPASTAKPATAKPPTAKPAAQAKPAPAKRTN